MPEVTTNALVNPSYFFDTSFLSSFFSIELCWKATTWLYELIRKPLRSNPGNQVFVWGSNSFVGCPTILSIEGEPAIVVETLGKRLYLSAIFCDRNGKVVMKVIRNKVILNRNNLFEVQVWRRDMLKVINQYHEPIEIIAHGTGEVELNGVFYYGGNRFAASPQGLKLN